MKADGAINFIDHNFRLVSPIMARVAQAQPPPRETGVLLPPCYCNCFPCTAFMSFMLGSSFLLTPMPCYLSCQLFYAVEALFHFETFSIRPRSFGETFRMCLLGLDSSALDSNVKSSTEMKDTEYMRSLYCMNNLGYCIWFCTFFGLWKRVLHHANMF